MLTKSAVVVSWTLLGTAWSHAVMTTPEPRGIGSAQEAVCGAAVTDRLDDDKAGPIENSVAVIDDDYHCNLFLCRGYQFEDNTQNILSLAGGDVLDIHIDIIAGHKPGYANISVVDAMTNQIIGEPLKVWDDFLSSDPSVPDDERDFNITIPQDLPTDCAEAGNCVIQWYWYATGNKQTYISCLDFEVTL
ncbi:uncharacterized protein F5Z01DRAFT_491259 [Emericellopsis atlantica]|uniref:Chitin-binding type-4 domain-containing protein n=1 Tax=Emericellopsis atlantica TaxID=2614577 RepID=A0A9P8CRC0_9HYPO|nr:uncharacterized protein F5Z01DRAFT_491259 [Emericellopsis atlantica]KAG9256859.1 hypothetical protein F5Z01DRAFT_491259 [Emericellopsis atlantica]